MLKIPDILKEIIENDEEAYLAFQRNILNFSAYAREIKNTLENRAKKPVKLKSIIVALSRLKKGLAVINPLPNLSEAKLNISLHSNLSELTYEKTTDNLAGFKDFYNSMAGNHVSYLAATLGLSEITIIGDAETMNNLKNKFTAGQPMFVKENLAGVTVRFAKKFIDTPNLLYALTKKLAIKKINIIEIISTFTEITFIVEKQDALIAIAQLEKG